MLMWLRGLNNDDIDAMVAAACAHTYEPSNFHPIDEDFQDKLAAYSAGASSYDPADLRAEGYSIVTLIKDARRRFAENYDRQHAAA